MPYFKPVNAEPLHDKVLILADEVASMSPGGLHLPDVAKDKPQEGLVVAVGEGRVLDDGTKLSLSVKEGDRVMFGKYSGYKITLDGQEYICMREEDLLLKLKGEASTKTQAGG